MLLAIEAIVPIVVPVEVFRMLPATACVVKVVLVPVTVEEPVVQVITPAPLVEISAAIKSPAPKISRASISGTLMSVEV